MMSLTLEENNDIVLLILILSGNNVLLKFEIKALIAVQLSCDLD